MRAITLPESEIERPRIPLSKELADIVERRPADVIETFSPLMSDERKERIDQVLSNRLRSLVVVIDHFQDPHNGAAILRTSEALGLIEIHAVMPGADWKLSRRVTQGCHKWLDIFVHGHADPCAKNLKKRGYTLLEATEKETKHDISSFSPDQPLALCLGNEHAGMTEELRRHCSARIGFPMQGFTKSLNVSVAAGLLIGGLIRERKRGLPDHECELLRARYYALSIRSPLDILKLRGIR